MPSYEYEFAVKKASGALSWFVGVIADAKDEFEAHRRACRAARLKAPNYDNTYGGVYAGPLLAEIKEGK